MHCEVENVENREVFRNSLIVYVQKGKTHSVTFISFPRPTITKPHITNNRRASSKQHIEFRQYL